MSIFDHLNNVMYDKPAWESLSDSDKKEWNTFMVNRWLSMDRNYIELVNELQHYTLGLLRPKDVYALYADVLPKRRAFNKYIGAKRTKKVKHDPKLVAAVARHYEIGNAEASSYVDTYKMSLDGLSELTSTLEAWGFSNDEIKKMMK